MRQRFLSKIAEWSSGHTWKMAAILFVITLVLGGFASQLTMNMNLTGLLPKGDPMVDEFNYIFEEFNGSSNAFIVVKGPYDKMVAYAEALSPKILKLREWIAENGSPALRKELADMDGKISTGVLKPLPRFYARVDYRQPRDFIRKHGLMLMSASDLKNDEAMLSQPRLPDLLKNLNESLEREYIQSEEKLSTHQKERNAVMFLDGLESWTDATQAALLDSGGREPDFAREAAAALTIGSPYFISPDRSMLIMQALPNFSMMDMDYLLPGINGLEEMAKGLAPDYGVTAGLTGGIVLGRDEYVAGMEDSMSLTIIALIAILLLFVVTFRMVAAPVLSVLTLIIGVVWAMGVTWFLVDELNMFTAMMAVVLVGLGIDYSIHIISVYSELTNKGVLPAPALRETLQKVGTGIMTGAVTTAAAFLTLMIARSQGMAEFGLVNGAGLIVIMISTLLTLPVMLMLREKYRVLRKKPVLPARDVRYNFAGKLAAGIQHHRLPSFIVLVLFTLVAIFYADKVKMDYNYLNMEPVGLESIRLNDEIIDKFNMSSDMTMMTSTSLEENYRYTEEAKTKSSISYVESIADYLPLATAQDARKPLLMAIHRAMASADPRRPLTRNEVAQVKEELIRLEDNVMEIQDMAFVGGQDMVDRKATRLVGNPDRPDDSGKLSTLIAKLEALPDPEQKFNAYDHVFAPAYRAMVLSMSDTSRITLADLPGSVREKYISEDGSRYLMTIYPKGNVWNIDYLKKHTRDMLDISSSIAGTPPMFYYLLEIIGADGAKASILTLLAVLLFLWVDFASLKRAFLALIPLAFGVTWMLGVMGLFGIKFTLLNIMALPLIIGIGIDDGVHILHRWSIEGKSNIYGVFASTGKAVIITSLTTMLSFGSLVFATYRGFGSLGIALFIGVGVCLLASLVILPAFLRDGR